MQRKDKAEAKKALDKAMDDLEDAGEAVKRKCYKCN